MYRSMNQDLIREILERHIDILTPAAKKEEERFKNLKCPVCANVGCRKIVKPPSIGPDGLAFASTIGFLLMDGIAECIECQSRFDPYTSVIQKTEVSLIHAPE